FSGSDPGWLQVNGVEVARLVSVIQSNKGICDYYFDDLTSDPAIPTSVGLSFESPQVYDMMWRTSYIDTAARYILGGLDQDYSETDFGQAVVGMDLVHGNVYDLPDTNNY